MGNLPLALTGGVIKVFVSGGTLSIASLVGFITLIGIAIRNRIMLITHYRHIAEVEGVPFRQTIIQCQLERFSPLVMTALVTGVGLIPLGLGVGQPGKEIKQSMAVVILGSTYDSTFLNMIVIPPLYFSTAERELALRTKCMLLVRRKGLRSAIECDSSLGGGCGVGVADIVERREGLQASCL